LTTSKGKDPPQQGEHKLRL